MNPSKKEHILDNKPGAGKYTIDQKEKHPVDAGRTTVDFAVISLKGFCMGIADVIPGISGGTIAFMLEIYEDLIKAIRSFDLSFAAALARGKLKEASANAAWRFTGSILLGIGTAILLFSRLIKWLFENYPVPLNAFFFGLILATVPIIARAMKQWTPGKLAVFIASTIGTFFFVSLSPINTPNDSWFLFLSGALAICAMILPGISGAFILLLLGKYHFILNAVHTRDIGTLLVFGAGILAGILSFVRVLEYLFRKFHDITIAVLAGFVLGSLNKIWPWKKITEWLTSDSGKMVPVQELNILPVINTDFFVALFLLALGFGTAYLLHAIPQKHTSV